MSDHQRHDTLGIGIQIGFNIERDMANGLKNNVWAKVTVVVVPLAIAGLVAFGQIKSDVRHVEDQLDTKANAETVQVQYEAIIQRLDDLKADIERLRDRD